MSVRRMLLLTASVLTLVPAVPGHAAVIASCSVSTPTPVAGGWNVKATGTAANSGEWDFRLSGYRLIGTPVALSHTAGGTTYSQTLFFAKSTSVMGQGNANLTFVGVGTDVTCYAETNWSYSPLGVIVLPA